MSTVAAAILLVTATAFAIDQATDPAPATLDDGDITSAVRRLLFGSRVAVESAISVQTLNGCVMLWGWVQSTDQRRAAENLAWRVKGVRSVQNELAVQP